MATINEKLQLALDSKANIKAAIEEKGGSVTDFASYADAIRNIKGGEEHSKIRFSAEFTEDAYPYLSNGLTSVFGSSTPQIRKLVLCGFGGDINVGYDSHGEFYDVYDLTIDNITYSGGSYNYGNADFIIKIGKNVSNGNLRLEGEWDEMPEEILDNFIGWELYINGEHIGTITPKVEGGYYYTESKKHDYYAGDGYNGTFKFDAGATNDYLIFYDGIPQELLNASYEGRSITSNRGEEGIMRSSGTSLYILQKEGIIEWLDIK